MREIKFRVWDSDIKQMFYDILEIEFRYDCIVVDDRNRIETLVLSECEFLQYTGLKDKNGKEIYEGDVVRVEKYKPFDAIVHFNKGAFWLYEHNSNVDAGVFDGDLKKELHWSISLVEYGLLTGNIYENPELIK